jgi:hypothetical protein
MIYTNDVPELVLFSKRVFLPKGEPPTRGTLIYHYTESVSDTIAEIENPLNYTPQSAAMYRFYFYTMTYSGKIKNRRFFIKDVKEKKDIYTKIKDETNLKTVPTITLSDFNMNCYFEMSKYLQIYYNMTEKIDCKSKVLIFWDYLTKILEDPTTSNYKTKVLLINADRYDNAFKGKLKEKLRNPLFMIYYTLLKDPSICAKFDHDIFIYYKNRSIRINPAHAEKSKTAARFKTLLLQLLSHVSRDIVASTDETSIQSDEKEEVVKEIITKEYNPHSQTVMNQTMNVEALPSVINKEEEQKEEPKEDTKEKKLAEDIDKSLNKKAEEISADVSSEEEAKRLAEEAIQNDKELLSKLYDQAVADNKPTSSASTARDKKIREEQGKIVVGNMSIDKIRSVQSTHMPIPESDVSNVMKTTNDNMKHKKFSNFEQTYTEKVFPKDMVNAFASLNDKSIPMTIIKYDVKDTSDELNYKDTYTVVLEDVNRQRHTISVDIPKFIDNRYMWIGGSKKMILYQNFLYPVVKSGPDEVQIVTNYNKMFIARKGTKSISSLERLNKFIQAESLSEKYFIPGYAVKLNAEYITTVEYDELSKQFLRFENGNTILYFSQAQAIEAAAKKGITIGDNEIFIGFFKGTPVTIDQNTQRTGNDKSITDIIIESLPEELQIAYEKTKAPKRLLYSVATTMRQPVALGLLLGFWEGLSSVMKNLGIEYTLETKAPSHLKAGQNYLQFADCTLVYSETIAQSLVMNGFRAIETIQYKITEMETKEPYMDYLVKVYGKRSIANALMNVYEFTIDPITKEILEDLNLPTTLVPLCIYANSLLADSQYTPDYNQKLCRIRSSEIVPSILYDAIAKQYIVYKNSNGKKKLSLPKDIVINRLLELPTVEDVSTLNPLLEMERKHTTMYKGWRGINSDHTYTQDKRVYDDSMIGIIGLATSPDGSVGVQKVLTMEPNVVSARGYLKVTNDEKELKDVNLYSPAEMLCPLGPTRDDPTRTGHGVKQSKHVIPVKHSSPVLISNGAEESVRFDLSSSFVINAKEDGTVVDEIVDKNGEVTMLICEYKDGTHQAIDLSPKIEKNGGGGFYLSNRMQSNLRVGMKFKKNDMLAWHKDFFKAGQYTGNRMNMGTMVKIGILSTYNTYQDSTVITEKMSHEMATEMAFNRQVVIGKNATVDFIANVGDRVQIGSSLIQFDTSYEDNELNKLLSTLSDELKEGVMENSRNNIKSKTAGVIEDIKMYSTVDLEELSPSLRAIFSKYYKKINEKKKMLSKYDPNDSIMKCGVLFTETTGKVTPNKYGMVKGQKLEDGVLIEFYIKHEEYLEIGSKVAYFTGLKATIGEVIPGGYEPYSEFRKDEEVSTLIASNSVLKRMTPSILLTSFGNKCIVELKRSLKTIFDRTPDDIKCKEEMLSLICRFFTAFDKTKTNTNKYKSMFEPMTPPAFRKWFRGFFEDEDAYLILDIVDYERTITFDDIDRAAKVINVPLFEYVYLPHVTMDKTRIIRTREKVPVGYIHVKRTQQTVAKKNGISTSSNIRSAMTGQVTGADKNGRESDLENSMLVALDMQNCLKELNGPRADDMVAKREMLSDIAKQGYVKYSDLTYDVNNKTTLNTVDTYFLGMGIKTDLVTKGLMLNSTLKKDM